MTKSVKRIVWKLFACQAPKGIWSNGGFTAGAIKWTGELCKKGSTTRSLSCLTERIALPTICHCHSVY